MPISFARVKASLRAGILLASPLLAILVSCAPMPTAVDTAEYVPLTLAPARLAGVRDARGDFRKIFCAEPSGAADDSVDTASCDAALRRFRDELPGEGRLQIMTQHRGDYRVVLALGMGWDCMRELIDETHLPTATLHESGYATTLVEVEGLSGSGRNAEIIASTLKAVSDERLFILVGYSKGASDLLVALQEYPWLAERTAAFVSVAGAVGGSPVVEHTHRSTMAALRNSVYADCTEGDGQVLQSLHPARRQAWNSDNLPLPVPSYSLITAPEPARVSRALRSSYKLLAAVHPINDGALLHWDQLLAGSTLLGYANADHWAVTVPIEVDDIPLGEFLVHNGFPRTRLWLAIADFVVADLKARAPAADQSGE